jgi:hypothetical protein
MEGEVKMTFVKGDLVRPTDDVIVSNPHWEMTDSTIGVICEMDRFLRRTHSEEQESFCYNILWLDDQSTSWLNEDEIVLVACAS